MARRIVRAGVLAVVTLVGCSAGASESADLMPRPLPTIALAGRTVTLYPLTMLVPERELAWDSLLTPRAASIARAEGLLESAVTERAPEIKWVLPEALRRTARQAPNMFADPDQMGTAVLRNPGFKQVPDPLRSQLRLLTGATGDRLALIPASLLFFRDSTGGGRAELTMVLADVRTGAITWRSTAKAVGPNPWDALEGALDTFLPIIP